MKSGLAIEPDKTEAMFFQRPRERNPAPTPTRILLPERSTSSYYSVLPVETLRYLGFFFQRRLKWEPHATIMCNRARASIKALTVLGNSIRRLSMANWQLCNATAEAFDATCNGGTGSLRLQYELITGERERMVE
jgi:hypothetical protein